MDADRTHPTSPQTISHAEERNSRSSEQQTDPQPAATALPSPVIVQADVHQVLTTTASGPPAPKQLSSIFVEAENRQQGDDGQAMRERSITAVSPGGRESNCYLPSRRATLRMHGADHAPGMDALVPILSRQNVSTSHPCTMTAGLTEVP